MEKNNQAIIGKVRRISEVDGDIVTAADKYLFFMSSLDGTELKVDDTVLFRGEQVQGRNIAFFIKKIDKDLNVSDQVLKLTKKESQQTRE